MSNNNTLHHIFYSFMIYQPSPILPFTFWLSTRLYQLNVVDFFVIIIFRYKFVPNDWTVRHRSFHREDRNERQSWTIFLRRAQSVVIVVNALILIQFIDYSFLWFPSSSTGSRRFKKQMAKMCRTKRAKDWHCGSFRVYTLGVKNHSSRAKNNYR